MQKSKIQFEHLRVKRNVAILCDKCDYKSVEIYVD